MNAWKDMDESPAPTEKEMDDMWLWWQALEKEREVLNQPCLKCNVVLKACTCVTETSGEVA